MFHTSRPSLGNNHEASTTVPCKYHDTLTWLGDAPTLVVVVSSWLGRSSCTTNSREKKMKHGETMKTSQWKDMVDAVLIVMNNWIAVALTQIAVQMSSAITESCNRKSFSYAPSFLMSSLGTNQTLAPRQQSQGVSQVSEVWRSLKNPSYSSR